jgi:acyl-CoA synthetase (AMP-forming)/AMP-acid ligase II
MPATQVDEPAAIIFTSGSTGPPKGVLYTQGMFGTQVAEIQSRYGIEPGSVDLACFPLFALFNSAMGVTTVLPQMDFSRPASADPSKLLAAANDWQVTQAFASPAVWRVLSAHCAKTGERIPSLRQVFSCGAPVPANVLRATLACVGEGVNMHTPYGMTECLPVSTIEAAEVLENTASRTDQGAGVCVGRKFESIEWRVIRITDEPIGSIEETEEMPTGEIGELVVRGPQVSPCYVTRQEANAAAKISAVLGTKYSVLSFDPEASSPFAHPPSHFRYWHRTGDVGYFDDSGRFWYCGRKSQRIESAIGPLYTECVEAVATSDPRIRRCALVGLGTKGMQIPVLVVEQSGARMYPPDHDLLGCLQSQVPTHLIQAILYYGCLPVDVRHNAKINRELLTRWAAKRIGPAVAAQSVGVLRSHAERGDEG